MDSESVSHFVVSDLADSVRLTAESIGTYGWGHSGKKPEHNRSRLLM